VYIVQQLSIDIFGAFDVLLLLKRGGHVIGFAPPGEHSQQMVDYFQVCRCSHCLYVGCVSACARVSSMHACTKWFHADVCEYGLDALVRICSPPVAFSGSARGETLPPGCWRSPPWLLRRGWEWSSPKTSGSHTYTGMCRHAVQPPPPPFLTHVLHLHLFVLRGSMLLFDPKTQSPEVMGRNCKTVYEGTMDLRGTWHA
jgi:hypothetical protein